MKKFLVLGFFLSFSFIGNSKQCETPNGFVPVTDISALQGLQLKNVDEVVMLDSFIQPVSLINFWASWCAPCQKEMPLLDLVSPSAQTITINLGDSSQDIERIFSTLQIKSLPKYSLADYHILKQLGFAGLPATIVKSPNTNYQSQGILKQSAETLSGWLSCLSNIN